MTSGKARSKNEIVNVVEELGYTYIDSYTNVFQRIIIRDDFGYKYDIYLNNFLDKRSGIRIVDERNPFSLENISLWLTLNNSQFELLEDNKYESTNSKLNLYCKNCKDYPKMSWTNIRQEKGCGICRGLQTGIYHNLEYQFPEIAKEWHPTKNGKLIPKDFTYASHERVYWLCSNGHEYFSEIANRTNMGSGCKKCSDLNKESAIATELKKYILNKYTAKDEYKILKNPNTSKWLLYDIYIFGGEDLTINGVYIEIHGGQHYNFVPYFHKNLERFENGKKLDKLKKNFAKKNGTYIEIDLRKIKTIEDAIACVEENKKFKASIGEKLDY